MRLFIALALPENIRQFFKSLQKPIDGIKWQPAGQLHITLQFLGETSPEKQKKLKQHLQTGKIPAFTLTINEIGVFPALKNAHVLWAGVKKTESLDVLQQTIEGVCQKNGFKAEKRSFTPHITLARIKNARPDKIKSFIDQYGKQMDAAFWVNDFILYASFLSDKGAEYELIKRYPLTK